MMILIFYHLSFIIYPPFAMDASTIIRQTRDNYNRIAPHFSDTRSRPWGELNRLNRYIKDGQKILDWGCGNGRLVQCLGDKKVQYFGVDQSIELIKIARARYKKEIDSGRVKFFCVAGGKKNFPDHYFDAVFMIASFFHLPTVASRQNYLDRIYNQLKSGGKLIMTVWNLESEWAQEASIKKGWTKIGDHDFLIPWRNPAGEVLCERYYHAFGRAELRGLLLAAGFRVKSMKYFYGQKQTVAKGGRNLMVVAVRE